jgi:hypothetical protein
MSFRFYDLKKTVPTPPGFSGTRRPSRKWKISASHPHPLSHSESMTRKNQNHKLHPDSDAGKMPQL